MRMVSVRLRLIGGFVAVCGLLIGATLIGLRTAAEQERLAVRIDQLLVLTRNMGEVKFRISNISAWQLSYAWEASWAGGPAAVNPASPSRRGFEDSLVALHRELEAVERGPLTARESKLLAEVRDLVATFTNTDARIVADFGQGTPEGFRNANILVLGASYETARRIQVVISKLVVSVSERSTAAQRQARNNARLGRRVQLAGSVVALLIASLISLLITRSIVVTVGEIVQGLERLGEDESGPQLPDKGRDELAGISRAFNRTASLLKTAHAEQRELTDRLRDLAYRDQLTGLLNRAEFFNRFDAAVERSKQGDGSVACLIIDLDHFKPINDRYGHAAGDIVLREIADRLRSQLRSTDVVARLGGDEFAIFVEGGAVEAVIRSLTGRILAAIRRPIKINGDLVAVTASVGAAIDTGRLGPGELLEAADKAMYAEKRRHHGRRHSSIVDQR